MEFRIACADRDDLHGDNCSDLLYLPSMRVLFRSNHPEISQPQSFVQQARVRRGKVHVPIQRSYLVPPFRESYCAELLLTEGPQGRTGKTCEVQFSSLNERGSRALSVTGQAIFLFVFI